MLKIELEDLAGGLIGGATFYLLIKLDAFRRRIVEWARKSLNQGD